MYFVFYESFFNLFFFGLLFYMHLFVHVVYDTILFASYYVLS